MVGTSIKSRDGGTRVQKKRPRKVSIPKLIDSEDTDELADDLGWDSQAVLCTPQIIEVDGPGGQKRRKKPTAKASEPSSLPSVTKLSDEVVQEYIKKEEAWHQAERDGGYCVPEVIYRSLVDMGFLIGPMPIQRAVFQEAINHRKDIIAAAVTGSGKTIAYLIPLIANLMDNMAGRQKLKSSGKIVGAIRQRIEGLVLVPSRELAVQVARVADQLVKHTLASSTPVRFMAAIGGLSHQKQVRILDSKKPHVVIGTPGRVWALTFGTSAEDGSSVATPSEYFSDWSDLRFIVIDEADAMTDSKKGEFVQLEKILKKVQLQTKKTSGKIQKMVFSATLALPPHLKKQFPKLKLKTARKGRGSKEEYSAVERLISQVNLRVDELAVCDLSTLKHKPPPPSKTNKTKGEESMIKNERAMDTKGLTRVQLQLPERLIIEKDTFDFKLEEERLYVHLMRHFQNDGGSKAIVFVRNKARVFRLTQLLKLMFGDERGDFNNPALLESLSKISQRAKVVGVMGDGKQGDRLKKFEEFAKEGDVPKIMVCTDGVMARGIDIPGVDLVVHFQCPVNAAVFVHRSGRTARGLTAKGKAICFDHDPKFHSLWRAIFKGVNLSFDDDAVECTWSDRLNRITRDQVRESMKLAQKITKLVDSTRNQRKKVAGYVSLSSAADLAADEVLDELSDSDEMDETTHQLGQVTTMKSHLYTLIRRRLFEPRPLWQQHLDLMKSK
eukprot:GHVH01001441.1.p1 GENE.GHVH01001441.1~~GHVH01001441.1.p1  ORF type:complete len:737 (+),score=117.10 GHVH01001441.1:41-2212(+)